MKRLAALLFVLLLPGPFRAAPRRATQAEYVRSDVRKAPPAERNPDARRERTPERAERYSSENWPTDDDAAVQRRLRPLHRPRVGFRIEQAAHAGDSLWIIVRIAVPHGAIRRGECFEASFLLHTDLRDPDAVGTELNRISLCGGRSAPQESPTDGQGPAAEFETRRRQVRHLYYSCKLAFDPRLEEHTVARRTRLPVRLPGTFAAVRLAHRTAGVEGRRRVAAAGAAGAFAPFLLT